jgi:undecaprenyl pyrophosphate phosphatase UppP
MKKNFILLIIGAVITLLFLVFSTKIFEMLYYERQFSNEMYNQNLYFVVAVITALIAWGLAGIFYYAINSVSFSRWYHWLVVLGVAVVLTSVVNYIYPNNIFSADGLDFTAQLFSFCVVNAALEAVLFIVASFSMRWWSSNCRHTPIPE